MKLFNQSTELRLGIQVVEYRCFILIKSLGENKNPSSLEKVFYVICLQYYDFSYTVPMYKNEDVLSTGFQQFWKLHGSWTNLQHFDSTLKKNPKNHLAKTQISKISHSTLISVSI